MIEYRFSLDSLVECTHGMMAAFNLRSSAQFKRVSALIQLGIRITALANSLFATGSIQTHVHDRFPITKSDILSVSSRIQAGFNLNSIRIIISVFPSTRLFIYHLII